MSGWGTSITLWDVADPAAAHRLGDHLESRDFGDTVAFSPDQQILAHSEGIGAQSAASLVDLHEPAEPRRFAGPLTGHTDAVRSLAFSPDGNLLATGSDDRSVILWDVPDPVRPVRLGQPLTGPGGPVTELAFAPDGRVLIGAAGNGETFLWDVEDPAQPVSLGPPLTAGQIAINAIAISADGNRLAVGDQYGAVVLWDLAGLNHLLDQPGELACARTGGGLERAEWDRYIDGLPYRDIC